MMLIEIRKWPMPWRGGLSAGQASFYLHSGSWGAMGSSWDGEGSKPWDSRKEALLGHTDLRLSTGNVVNGTIARQMVDMLVESSSNVEMILKFFDMFLKLKDIVGSEAFQDYVTDPRGLISKKDFQKVSPGKWLREGGEVGGRPSASHILPGCLPWERNFSASLSFLIYEMRYNRPWDYFQGEI